MLALIPSPNPFLVSVSESWMSFSCGNAVFVYENYELVWSLEFQVEPTLTAITVGQDGKWVNIEAN